MRGGRGFGLGLAATLAAALPVRAADVGSAQVLVTGTGSNAMPAWLPGGHELVFHSRRKEAKQRDFPTRNIWKVGADGSGERQLTHGTKDEYHPSISPDGRKLLFVSELNGSRDIWVADPDGENAVPLTDGSTSSPSRRQAAQSPESPCSKDSYARPNAKPAIALLSVVQHSSFGFLSSFVIRH